MFLFTQTAATTVEVAYDEQEQADTKENSSEDQLTISEAVTSSGPQINLGFQSFLLEEMTQDEASEDEGALEKQIVSSTQKALKILFRRIISPNAP